MKEIAEIAAATVHQMIESGKIKKLVEESVAKTVASSVQQCLQSYSDFGKKITEGVEQMLSFDVKDLGLDGYNQVILAVIKQKLAHAINVAGKEQIEKDMTKLLTGVVPAEITVSKLVDKFKRWAGGRDSYRVKEGQTRVTCLVEKCSYGDGHEIYLGCKPNQDKYRCDFHIRVDRDGRVWMVRLEGKDASTTIFLGPLYNFEKTLFQMYTNKTKVIIDTMSPDDSLRIREDDEGDDEGGDE